MKKIRLAAHAVDDLREARQWYDAHSSGTGQRFVEAVDAILAIVSEYPQRFAIVHADVRRALVPSFGYALIYRDLPEFVRVVAVVHQHRSTQVWKRRR